MSYSEVKVFDGYAIGGSPTGFSFQTPWYDLKNAYAWSATVRTYGFQASAGSLYTGATGGTLYVQVSNENAIGAPAGGIQNALLGGALVATAVNSVAFGEQPRSNGLDAIIPSGIMNIVGPTTLVGTGTTTLFNDRQPGYRWGRIGFTGATVGTALCDIWMNAKW